MLGNIKKVNINNGAAISSAIHAGIRRTHHLFLI